VWPRYNRPTAAGIIGDCSNCPREVSTGTTRIETADVEALEHRVREIRHGLITFDGCMLAGKTELMREIARRLRVQGLDLDDFVERQQGVFVEALRLQELTAAKEHARAKSGVVLLSGICMLEALERIGRESNLTVYVQANNQDGTPDDIDLIGAETGRRPDLI
jgi:uridine kinase